MVCGLGRGGGRGAAEIARQGIVEGSVRESKRVGECQRVSRTNECSGVQTVAVYCASSRCCDSHYFDAAAKLGGELARQQISIVYGGGAGGLMGALANGALALGGRVVGILPRFMDDLKWGHGGITEKIVVEDMHARKRAMLERADAVVALPGGCGTLEELFEAIAWKRLSLFLGPIVIVNTRSFFDRCVRLLDDCVAEGFMDRRHRAMWTVVDEPEEVVEAIRAAPRWEASCRDFAVPGLNAPQSAAEGPPPGSRK